MSFSSEVKEELTKIAVKDSEQRTAELVGFMISNCVVTPEYGEYILKMSTENEYAIRRLYTFFKAQYNIVGKTNVERPKRPDVLPLYHMKISDKASLKILFEKCAININEKLQIILSDKNVITQNEECKRAFLRGIFLGTGSVVNPDSRYHLEIVIMESFEINSKMIKRKKDYIIYIKLAESISTFLAVVGANQGTIKFEEARVIKEVRNNINRVSNFENANFDKTVDASLIQIEDINLLKKNKKFSKLPSHLKEIAKLRITYKEATFEELGKMLEPNLSRAGVSHRFKKIHELAEEFRKNSQES